MPQALTIPQALDLARDLLRSGRVTEAAQVCTKILEADPESAGALHLLAFAAHHQGDSARAIELLGLASQASPQSPEIRNDLGNLQQLTGALDDAVASYRTALRLRPGFAEVHRNLASALRRLGRNDEAVASLETAVSLNPEFTEAAAQLVYELKQRCAWTRVDDLTRRLIHAVNTNSAPVNPFIFLALETTAAQQLRCASQWAAAHLPSRPPTPFAKRAGQKSKITLGYLSADFQEHATAHLAGELFGLHDRSRFRVLGFSYGKDDGSATRRRLAESFDGFADLQSASHQDAVASIRQNQVDILIDLKGYTTDARPQIVAMRTAPIQVSYLGYPGTMGTGAIDYVLVDPICVPKDQQIHFKENLVHLPDCYQINDRRRTISSPPPTREQCGLPEDAFVFTCLSAPYKITAPVFDVWMRLLRSVPGSILWLLESSPAATTHLRQEAELRLPGGSSRLVFAPALPNAAHLARFAVADLFLDTLPYNAHTLTSDALWGGCPVVTCAGETFASRVAASILHAIGLPELVTTNLTDYEALAIRLAGDREFLREIRRKLRDNRLATPLFDSEKLTRNIEAAFEEMWRRYQSGEPPLPFSV